MATTTLADIYNREALASYFVRDPVEKSAFFDSGIFAITEEAQTIITALADSKGNGIVSIPFWNAIDASIEPNYSNDVYQDVAVPRKVDTGDMTARIAFLNEGFQAARFVQMWAKQDPLGYVASVIEDFWRRQAQRRAIAAAIGVYNHNVASDSGDMVYDAADGSVTEGLIYAEATMGDSADISGYAMHSATQTKLKIAGLTQAYFNPITGASYDTYLGKAIVVDDAMPSVTVGGTLKRLTIAFGGGAFAYASSEPAKASALDEEEARGNGGGVDTLWTRKNMLIHPAGYSFTSASITGNGTETTPRSAGWTDLRNAANWERSADRKNVRMAFLLTNAA